MMGFWETVGAIWVALVLFRFSAFLTRERVIAKIHAEELVRLLLQTNVWWLLEERLLHERPKEFRHVALPERPKEFQHVALSSEEEKMA